MSNLDKALLVAVNAHAGQRDKAGEPYIMHPLRVMMTMANDSERITALLHDVIEDSDYTRERIKEDGFSEEVLEALLCLSKMKGEKYDSYIERVSQNPLAQTVKIADLRDNLNLARLSNISSKDVERVRKYQIALKKLTS